MFDIRKNYEIAKQIATEGVVLLKNENGVLPFKNEKVGIVGKEAINLISGGGGAADVKCDYIKSLSDSLVEKKKLNKLEFYEESISIAKENDEYTQEQIDCLAKHIDTAIFVIRRNSGEGFDRGVSDSGVAYDKDVYAGEAVDYQTVQFREDDGFYYPSDYEINMLEKMEKSNIKNIVLILNISSTVDISFTAKFPKIKSIVLTYFPGMEGGSAIADILCGEICPSGKLVDTIPYQYGDFPSADSFNKDFDISEYREDIFVGYRYFETYASNRVMYPFGYGLSYTSFEFSDYVYEEKDGFINVGVNVKNIGLVPGKEVVQVYTSSPKGELKKAAIELRGFAKTKLLSQGESEKVTISFAIKDMASFDTDGRTGYKAAWVLEKGNYEIRVGNSIRNTTLCGIYSVNDVTVTEQLTLRFDGSEYDYSSNSYYEGMKATGDVYTLYDVSDNKVNIYEFIKQMTPYELITIAQGQPSAYALGTGGIGNIKKYQIPNPQTADGPAGLRRSVNATFFPCGTLIASTWNKNIQFAMGEALGKEALSADVDILLAPSMNIHRNPLCGRSFEYFSEDPLLTGKTAVAIVNGLQSTGVCATLKHFMANNCEMNRKENNSVISERAIREIYLKGFEIAVKESNPTFIMTAYNKLNGIRTSEHSQLLRGVVRDEWGFDGAIMTDWRCSSGLVKEIKAGNNIKMPYGYPDEAEKAYEAYVDGKLSIEVLRENAFYVLNAVMKTNRFADRNFGIVHIVGNSPKEISAIEVSGVSATWVLQSRRDDGTDYLYHLYRDPRSQRTFVYYELDVHEEGNYIISAEVSTNSKQAEIWYYNYEDERIGTAFCGKASNSEWFTVDTTVNLKKGENRLKVVFAVEPHKEYGYIFDKSPRIEDIQLAKLLIAKQ